MFLNDVLRIQKVRGSVKCLNQRAKDEGVLLQNRHRGSQQAEPLAEDISRTEKSVVTRIQLLHIIQ